MSRRPRSAHLIVGLLVAVVAVPALLMGPVGATNSSDLNHPSYYEALGYGTCVKYDPPADPFILGTAPAGWSWSLLVLKAGSAQSNSDWNTMIPNPNPGSYEHPSGKDLSHVIVCKKNGTGGGGGGSDDDDGSGDDDDGIYDNDDDDGCSSTPSSSTPSSSTPAGDDDDDGHGDDDDGIYDNDDDDGCGTTTTTSTIPGGDCDEYTPSQLTVTPSTAAPGESIIIAGVAVPGDTVTAEFETSPGNVVILGSAVAGPTGQFSITGVVPAVANNNYNIIVSSTQCPISDEVTINVRNYVFSGCGVNNAARTLHQGETFFWALHTPSFDTTKPVTMKIKKGSTVYTLYTGPWPGTNQLSLTIPAAAPLGQYTMEQIGQKPNGKVQSKTCPIWVELAYTNSAARSALPSGSDGESMPMTLLPIAALVTLGSFTLIRLRPAKR